MVLKDPIFGLPMVNKSKEPVKLTGPEHSANVLQMKAHREHKCGRCLRRYDLESGRYICIKEMNAQYVMLNDKFCKNFYLNEDPSDWREDLV